MSPEEHASRALSVASGDLHYCQCALCYFGRKGNCNSKIAEALLRAEIRGVMIGSRGTAWLAGDEYAGYGNPFADAYAEELAEAIARVGGK